MPVCRRVQRSIRTLLALTAQSEAPIMRLSSRASASIFASRPILTIPNPLHGRFVEMVDAVLGKTGGTENATVRKVPEIETWAVPLQDIYDNVAVRLDASHYNRETAVAL